MSEEFQGYDSGRMMLTHSGKRVNPLLLNEGDIDIYDIAHALSLINRFGGHTKYPISVAMHSAYVSYLCEAEGPIVALQGLFHDGSEAYLGDVITWIKKDETMRVYRIIEDEVQNRIYNVLRLPLTVHPAVQRADAFMCEFEGSMLIEGWDDRLRVNVSEIEVLRNWFPVGWETAKHMFIKQWQKLTKALDRQQ